MLCQTCGGRAHTPHVDTTKGQPGKDRVAEEIMDVMPV